MRSDFLSDFTKFNGQYSRILSRELNADVDFYMILLRRLYREIEFQASNDSRVANLKGKYKGLCKKIKIRDQFEHPIDKQKISHTPEQKKLIALFCQGPLDNVKLIKTLIKTNESLILISGNQSWDFINDHRLFLELCFKFMELNKINTVFIESFKPLENKICL